MVTVAERVAGQLREKILNGKYKPGQRLHEVFLTEDLNASRTPVRDALRVLSNEELLSYSPNRGYTVKEIGLADLKEIWDVHAYLAGLLCRTVAELGISDKERQELEEIINSVNRLLESNSDLSSLDWRERYKTGIQFYFALADMSHNKYLASTVKKTADILLAKIIGFLRVKGDPWITFEKHFYSNRRMISSNKLNRQILEAILCREGGRAEVLISASMFNHRDSFFDMVDPD